MIGVLTGRLCPIDVRPTAQHTWNHLRMLRQSFVALVTALAVTGLLVACTGSGHGGKPTSSSTAALPTISMHGGTVALTGPLASAAASAHVTPTPIDSVSCADSFCMVGAGDVGLPISFAAASPKPGVGSAILAGHSEARFTISCTSSTFCLAAAVDGSGLAARWNGTSWTKVASLPSGALQELASGMACGGPSLCLAIVSAGGSHPTVAAFTGRSWQTSKLDSAGQQLIQVSCAGLASCLALGTGGVVVRYSQGQWTAPTVVNAARSGAADYPAGVSCAAGPFCVLAGSRAGVVLESSGGAFAPTDVPALRTIAPQACGSAQFCLVQDRNTGQMAVLIGNQLRRAVGAELVGRSGLPSCTAARLCVGLASGGTVLNWAEAG